MIRILTTNDSRGITITIDGELAGDDVKAVERCCDELIRENGSVRLFLREVSQIDEAGRMLLSRLVARGVELNASGVYTSFIVGEIQRQAGVV
jgi:ABC-type transporter Mla MlaB component